MKTLVCGLLRLLSLIFVLTITVASASAVRVNIISTTYPIRWGLSEQNDDVAPYAVLGKPVCLKRGSTIKLTVDPSETRVLRWFIHEAKLISNVDNTVYWTYTDLDSPTDTTPTLHTRGEEILVGVAPNKVEYARLEALVVCEMVGEDPPMAVRQPKRQGTKAARNGKSSNLRSWGTVSIKYGSSRSYTQQPPTPPDYSSDVFVVLDTPKAPMAKPWVPILRYSCRWGWSAISDDEARQYLTQCLYAQGEYNGGHPAFASGSTFYLKDYLNESGLKAQCDDFSDFLVCLVNSVGSAPLQVQRSNANNGNTQFKTNYIYPAKQTRRSVPWVYHQFTGDGTNVWDACLGFENTSSPPYGEAPYKMPLDPAYRNNLVKLYYTPYSWNPSSANVSVTTLPTPW